MPQVSGHALVSLYGEKFSVSEISKRKLKILKRKLDFPERKLCCMCWYKVLLREYYVIVPENHFSVPEIAPEKYFSVTGHIYR